MATKRQVLAILKKQGAEWEIEKLDPFTFSAWLPEDKIWNNGYGNGSLSEEKDGYGDETMGEFWDSIVSQIDYEVIDKP